MSYESTRRYTLEDLEAARRAGYELGYAAGVGHSSTGGGVRPVQGSPPTASDHEWYCTGQPRPPETPDGGWPRE